MQPKQTKLKHGLGIFAEIMWWVVVPVLMVGAAVFVSAGLGAAIAWLAN